MKAKSTLALAALAIMGAWAYLQQQPQAGGSTTAESSTQNEKQIHRTLQTPAPNTSNSSPDKYSTENEPVLNLRRIEIPKTSKGELTIAHVGYTLSYDKAHNTPRWVAWQLTEAETEDHISRDNTFYPDPDIEECHRVTTDDYKASGYDRGHMVPAADMHWDARAMTECFYMSNICPQEHSFNAGSWATLEKACRRWAKQEGSVYIVCGPIYSASRKQKYIGKAHRVGVPDSFFKVVLSLRKGQEKAIGFMYANNDTKQQMQDVARSVDEVEQITGIDFFPNINDKLEERIEATCSLKAWN